MTGPLIAGNGWAISEADAAAMFRDSVQACRVTPDIPVEIAWSLVADFETRRLHSPEVIGRGNCKAAFVPHSAPEAGRVILHSHPQGQCVPSDGDIIFAQPLAAIGCGFGICDPGIERVLLICEPRPVAAPSGKRRSWSWGRWMLHHFSV